jgi:HD-GYP domain-containing protein (c-di-GMP phosphodiesterase class II)
MISALCHDVGKIGIPDAILKKASILSAEEYEEMKLHPKIGVDIISNMPNARKFLSGIKSHHEKWDGTGYPDGLAGEEIPFFGRIVAIADVFDAMVSGRAYSGFMDQSDAIQRLVEESELFDPEILKACVRAHDSGSLTLKTNTAGNIVPAKVGSLREVDQKAQSEQALQMDEEKAQGPTKIRKKSS